MCNNHVQQSCAGFLLTRQLTCVFADLLNANPYSPPPPLPLRHQLILREKSEICRKEAPPTRQHRMKTQTQTPRYYFT